MYKNDLLLVLGGLSALLVTLAVSRPFSKCSASHLLGTDEPYGLYPGWAGG